MKKLFRRCAVALALLSASALPAQTSPVVTATGNNGRIVPLNSLGFGSLDSTVTPVDASHPLPVTSTEAAATSIAQLGSITNSTATPTSGAATIAAGVATVGPLTPQLGRSVRVLLKGTWAGTIFIGTSADACVTINPLTIGGQPWATFTGNANEDVDTPHIAGVVYCARATITSGTLTYAVRQ